MVEGLSPSAGSCHHCGLPTGGTDPFCCYGCELAASIRVQAREDHGQLYETFVFVTILSMIVMMASLFLYAEDVFGLEGDTEMAWLRSIYRWLALALSIPVMALAGSPLLKRGLAGLRAGRPSMEGLIGVAAWAAFLLSVRSVFTGGEAVYFETATAAVVLATFGRYLEATARSHASQSLGPLMELSQGMVRVIGPEGETAVPATQVEVGARLVIAPDQVVPVDLELEADASLDLAVLTGESLPVTRRAGDHVPAGAVAVGSVVRGVARSSARESALQRLAELARSLREGQAPFLMWADRFARAIAPIACGLALVGLGLGWAEGTLDTGVVRALAVLLAACPCAYAIASPLVYWLVLRRAFARGVIIRTPEVLEALAAIRRVAFDKTGTLTSDRPRITEAVLAEGADRGRVKGAILALEAEHTHPVARALIREVEGWDVPAEGMRLTSRRFVAGRGVEACDEAGRALFVGLGEEGRTGLVVDGEEWARFDYAEELRPEAVTAVRALASLGIEVEILSGDRVDRVESVGRALGIVGRGGLTPEAKVAALDALGVETGMVGDGVNDVPALAGRLTGFTFAGSAPLARGVAQVTLSSPDLELIPWVIELARTGLSRARFLILAATSYNVIFISLALTGWLKPALAGLSMLVSSLLSLAVASSLGIADEGSAGDLAGAVPREVPS